jgi:hypothetical protein
MFKMQNGWDGKYIVAVDIINGEDIMYTMNIGLSLT